MDKKVLIDIISKILTNSQKCIYYSQQQNISAMINTVKLIINDFINIIDNLLQYDLDNDNLITTISNISCAQEANDYILVSDLLESNLIPILYNYQSILLDNVDIFLEEDDFSSSNLSLLKLKNKELFYALTKIESCDYINIEPTSSGLYTMRVTDLTGSYYFHSNINPLISSINFARRYYDICYDNYTVLGLGLGYHINELLNIDDGIKINIIEPDINIIYTAFKYMDLSGLLKNENINIIYCTDLSKLNKYILVDSKLIIHYPSLRHLTDPNIKFSLEKYFTLDNGAKNTNIQMHNNFRANKVFCNYYIDSQKKHFCGKNAIIVAAGPSLDKNISQLHNLPCNTLIVAVGTVYKKLINLNIIPNFVIFLDATSAIYKQIDGLEDKEIPIICCSTAYKGISQNYKGPKYLACQEGFSEAKDYALSNGYSLFESGSSVSTIALDICLKLGCANICFIGLDLAYTNGKNHATDTPAYALENEEHNIMIPAIGGGEVATSKLFLIYKDWIEKRAVREPFGKIIDASEGGALKRGIKTMPLKSVLDLFLSQQNPCFHHLQLQ